MPTKKNPAPKNKSLESWIWDAACSICRAKARRPALLKLYRQEYAANPSVMANMNKPRL